MTYPYGNPGTALTGVVAKTWTRVVGLNASNANPADRFLLLFNKTAPPTANDPPDYALRVPAQSQSLFGSEFFGADGCAFANGLAWAWSTSNVAYDGLATPGDHTLLGTYAA